VRRIASGLLLLAALLAAAPAQQRAAVSAVEAVGFTVGDLDRSVEFFARVLTFERLGEREVDGDAIEHLSGVFGVRARIARLRLGSEAIELTEFLAPRGRPIPVDSRSNDRWFQHIAIVVRDMDAAYRHLRAHRVEHASSGPQLLPAWNEAAGGIRAFYFKDPDGHVLEVLQFPPGKGDPRWQQPGERLFLGIDHTAIVVDDTERSLRFYRDVLGMRIAGESENWGIEQERLNNVFGARLRITTLRAEAGPGVELLEYLAPRDGRPMPVDSRANDLWAWRMTLTAVDVAQAENVLRASHAAFVSSGVIDTQSARALQVRDPDGHAFVVTGSRAETGR
jgi:catechol 2,3-dioxygenase-like lactoylglutathione lyase family enzyme